MPTERVDSARPTRWIAALFRLPTDRQSDSLAHHRSHFDSGVGSPGETPTRRGSFAGHPLQSEAPCAKCNACRSRSDLAASNSAVRHIRSVVGRWPSWSATNPDHRIGGVASPNSKVSFVEFRIYYLRVVVGSRPHLLDRRFPPDSVSTPGAISVSRSPHISSPTIGAI